MNQQQTAMAEISVQVLTHWLYGKEELALSGCLYKLFHLMKYLIGNHAHIELH